MSISAGAPAAPKSVTDPATGVPETRRRSTPPWAPGLAVLLAMALATAFVCIVFWPGDVDPDTADEIGSSATGQYNDWHAPIMSALWRGPYLLGLHSSGWLLAITVFAFLVGLYLVLRIRMPRPAATVVAMVIVALPQVIGWAVHVGRDAWFVALFLCAVGLLARATRSAGRVRTAFLVLSFASAFLAEAARQNAPPALLPLFCAAAALLLAPRWSGWRRAGLVCGAGLAMVAVVVGSQLLINRAVLHAAVQHPEQTTYVADLARMSVHENRNLFPADVYPSQDLDRLRRWEKQSDNVDLLLWGPDAIVTVPLPAPEESSLAHAWLSAVTGSPATWLRVRGHMALGELAVKSPAVWVFQYPYGPPGYSNPFPNLRLGALNYMNAFTTNHDNALGGPIHAVWAYMLLVLAGTAWYLTRGGAGRLLGVAGLGVVLLSIGVFLAAPDVGYRYMLPVVVFGLVLLATALWDAARALLSRSSSR